jgi:N-acetylmuramic acid 6-phosphate etherase
VRPLDLLPLREQLARMHDHEAAVPGLVAAAAGQVAALVERAVAVVRAGGRVVYLGAGSAGRIAAQDAAEVGPTFGVPEGTVLAVVAGGAQRLQDAAEGLEDDEDAAAADLDAVGLSSRDLLVAVSASGSTPYTRAGLRVARQRRSVSAAVVCAAGSPMAREADHAVVVPIGAEVVRGSTRLAAGTAQKLVLNQLSTLTMVRLGHVYGDLMIGVRPDNTKLRARVLRAVAIASGGSEAQAAAALEAAGGNGRVALIVARLGVPAEDARRLLAAAGDDVRAALGERPDPAERPEALDRGRRATTGGRGRGLAVGVDVGGTKVAAGLVDGCGTVLARIQVDTPADARALDEAVVHAVRAVAPADGGGDLPVGVATAGLVDPDRGGVRLAANLPWTGHPVRERLQLLLGRPVSVDNDADAAGWAEYRFGVGTGARQLAVITVGTGLGGALVLDGRLRRGGSGQAGEFGHLCLVPGGLPCGCGARGCWERYCSGSALAAEAGADARAVSAAALAGDARASALVEGQGRRLGEGIAVLVAVLDPDVVVIGGGLAALGERLLGPARLALAERLGASRGGTPPRVCVGNLGNDAGIVGAADLARRTAGSLICEGAKT